MIDPAHLAALIRQLSDQPPDVAIDEITVMPAKGIL
jgi:NADP-dependent 3-hydroxy acid dehydrogenase YdfG